MNKTLAVSATLALLLLAVPAAEARPECLQVYPWSELCSGDVEGFQEAVVNDDVCYQEPSHVRRCHDATQTVTGGLRAGLPDAPQPQLDCIQVYPWSALCQGRVVEFACYYAKCDAILA